MPNETLQKTLDAAKMYFEHPEVSVKSICEKYNISIITLTKFRKRNNLGPRKKISKEEKQKDIIKKLKSESVPESFPNRKTTRLEKKKAFDEALTLFKNELTQENLDLHDKPTRKNLSKKEEEQLLKILQ